MFSTSCKIFNQVYIGGLLKRNINDNYKIVITPVHKFCSYRPFLEKFRSYNHLKLFNCEGGKSISYLLKENLKILKKSANNNHSLLIIKQCSKQFEFIIAHKLRRYQQVLLVYSKWWDEHRLKILIQNIIRSLFSRNCILYSSAIISCLSNETTKDTIDSNLIQESEFSRYAEEINRVYALKGIPPKTECNIKPAKLTSNKRNSHCKCSRCRHGTSIEGWVEIYNKDNLTFWKKEHLDHKGKGLYCYKVYGFFTDITAEDFLQVQINVDFRKEWDQTAIELKIIDQDLNSHTDIVYWELRFPRFFTNRDYVFLRRCKVDNERKVITIINQTTNHSSCPPKSGKHRVQEFWSYMVIKPTTDFDKPGLEFVITYFDNPGIRMPAYITSWLTFTEMPDFISRQHSAAILWSKQKQQPHNDDNSSTFPEPNNNANQSRSPESTPVPPSKTNPNPPVSPSYYQMVKNSICYMFNSS